MAVDLLCYVALPKAEVECDLQLLRKINSDLLTIKFIVYSPNSADPIEKEIAAEYGLEAQSTFMVSLNDKSAADLVVSVVNMLKQALGKENIVILHGNSVLM